MQFLERDLEDIIFYSHKKLLEDRGLYLPSKLLRQVKIGNYGIADLIGFQRPFYNPYCNYVQKGEITVVELKQNDIDINSFLQSLKYLKGIKSFLEKRNSDNLYNYKIVLIGKKLNKNNSFYYLTEFANTDFMQNKINESPFFNLYIYTYSYKIDGITFIEELEHKVINEGF